MKQSLGSFNLCKFYYWIAEWRIRWSFMSARKPLNDAVYVTDFRNTARKPAKSCMNKNVFVTIFDSHKKHLWIQKGQKIPQLTRFPPGQHREPAASLWDTQYWTHHSPSRQSYLHSHSACCMLELSWCSDLKKKKKKKKSKYLNGNSGILIALSTFLRR